MTGCPVCGQARVTGPSRRCPNRWCGRSDRAFSVAFSLGVHQGALRRAITRYKYGGDVRLADVFAGMIARYVESHPTWFEEFDVLTSVPAYIGPGARRDWDPMDAVAGALADRLGGRWHVARRAITKAAETPAMAGLSWAERQAVARTALRPSLCVPDRSLVAGCQIVVVDDVLTDGSTLREVALALRGAGAMDVAGLVLARPPWSPEPPSTPVAR